MFGTDETLSFGWRIQVLLELTTQSAYYSLGVHAKMFLFPSRSSLRQTAKRRLLVAEKVLLSSTLCFPISVTESFNVLRFPHNYAG